MIGYVCVGTNDMGRATRFYDALFGEMGVKRMMEFDGFVLWGKPGAAALAVVKPFDGNSATVGNGVMVALSAGSKANVDKFYAKAMELGGTDEGKPGARGDTFYAAYFRDPDGNKLNVFFMG
ncbi:glyoxalase [Solimonas fluminis]|uniref:Glyoxalase n=1 Tax=Solimonas fluminis TaxID=2086571 RepID=A0A2S5TEX3_9GAMM|nr:VOC family protein [Solimonas fluminis]PPE73541.1 glyoxalase [Solimonas fluminis]